MSNPRKFSEKIALHNQKQAEETAAFEKIMREVSDATSKPDENTLIHFGLGPQNILNDIATQESINSENATPYRESRGRSVGVGPMRRPADRKIDTSPYSSGSIAYLSPPSDSNWRRTSSDSAIHQSLQQSQDNHHSNGSHSPIPNSPIAHRRITNTSSNIDIKTYGNEHGNNFVLNSNDGRPRSSCGLPRPPGINIYHSAHDNTVQIPIGNNTGSLPDLTSVHFPSPLPTPLDQEHDHSSSPYSSSPITTSPTTLSPTSIPARHPTVRFPYSPVHSPGEASAVSPTHGTNQHFLSVPGSKYLQNIKGGSTDNNSYQTQGGQSSYINQQNQQSTQQQTQQNHLYNQQNQHSPPNNVLHGSQGNLTASNQSNLSGYRSPGRPSPGSSPGLVAMPNSDSSAPCSPASQPLGNNGQFDQFQSGEYYLNPSIQQHFEQFSLYDEGSFMPVSSMSSMQSNQMQISSPLGLSNPNINLNSTTLASNVDTFNHVNQSNSLHSSTSQQSGHHQSQQQQQHVTNTISNTQHHSQTGQNSQPQQCSQAPNTPTSIPEIIFSDCSGDLTKDLFDDQLRPIELELGAMDFAGFQMLSDPNATMIADPTIEDSFRRDLN